MLQIENLLPRSDFSFQGGLVGGVFCFDLEVLRQVG